MIKKFVAIILVVTLMMTMTVTAFASNDEQITVTPYHQATSEEITEFEFFIFIGLNDTEVNFYIFYAAILQIQDLGLCVTITPVLFVDPWGLDSYIFYDSSFEYMAYHIQKMFFDFYGYESYGSIHMIFVDSGSKFIDYWNAMGTNDLYNLKSASIDGVFIITHSTPWSTFDNSFGVEEIKSLESKNMDFLILAGCNAGNIEYKNLNLAAYFVMKVYGAPVLASDGTVGVPNKNLLANLSQFYELFGLTYRTEFKSINDKAFKDLNQNKRNNDGWLIYQYSSSNRELSITKFNEKSITFNSVFLQKLKDMQHKK